MAGSIHLSPHNTCMSPNSSTSISLCQVRICMKMSLSCNTIPRRSVKRGIRISYTWVSTLLIQRVLRDIYGIHIYRYTTTYTIRHAIFQIIIIIIIIINIIKKEAENILKYKDLTIEIQRMWNVKTKVIPVIIGATGTISKSFRKYVRNILGKHEVKELQKTAILGTTHILRKVLM